MGSIRDGDIIDAYSNSASSDSSSDHKYSRQRLKYSDDEEEEEDCGGAGGFGGGGDADKYDDKNIYKNNKKDKFQVKFKEKC